MILPRRVKYGPTTKYSFIKLRDRERDNLSTASSRSSRSSRASSAAPVNSNSFNRRSNGEVNNMRPRQTTVQRNRQSQNYKNLDKKTRAPRAQTARVGSRARPLTTGSAKRSSLVKESKTRGYDYDYDEVCCYRVS